LREINQPKLERIVEFVLEAKEGTFRLLIELFARGNVILCRDDYTIIYALEQVRFREREIRSKLAYAFPKQMADLTNFKVEDLRELLQKTDKESLVTFLAVSVGVSGLYAEEICTASHVDKSKISLNQDELDRVYKAIIGLFEREPKPNVVYDNGVIDVVPFELEVYKNNDKKYFQSYNEAIAAFLKEGPARRPKEDNLAKERERLLKIIKVQTEGIAEMEKEVEENQRKGQLVYEHYQEIKATIDKINADLKRLSKEGLEKKYRKVHEIDLKDKTIILRI
jgi:predicted ribosome quality control (RQC) complex YloA/Tae2 family protein